MSNAPTPLAISQIESLANEGVPICAIARAFLVSASDIKELLDEACDRGALVEVPNFDWPPGTGRLKRMPAFAARMSPADFITALRETFSLTMLEAEFLKFLLNNNRADKTKLHAEIGRAHV